MGAIERRKVRLRNTRQITRSLASSVSKLESIREAARLEHNALGNDLRMVILTDFIRKADLPKSIGDEKPIGRIGVVPIFELLRRDGLQGARLGVLSGSLVIIPRSAEGSLLDLAASREIKSSLLRCRPLAHDEGYCRIEATGHAAQRIVRIVTAMFTQGDVTVLVGTKSLLGEGWDAPSINALVLASFVGSYMLSNQMRGRAIRTQRGNPGKTANIWHLVCVEPHSKEPGNDLLTMTRRFRAFCGVSFREEVIENGIERLDMGDPPFGRRHLAKVNERMSSRALDRERLREDWEQALLRGEDGVRLVEEVRATEELVPRSLLFEKTIMALLREGLFAGAAAACYALQATEIAGKGLAAFLVVTGIALTIGAIVALPKCIKAGWLFLRYGPVAGSMRQIGRALLRTLTYLDIVHTPLSKMSVRTDRDEYRRVLCRLAGATPHEKAQFLQALQEILDPIENPRYLLMRKSLLGRLVRRDYHAVPQVIGTRKERAAYFCDMWRRYVGECELIYTRNLQGRIHLLQARANSLASAMQQRSERRSVWK
jgi:hypothetical protein